MVSHGNSSKLRPFLNKVVVISGSSMGIGKALAKELAQSGAHVVLNGRDAERLKSTKKALSEMGLRTSGIVADIRDPISCEQLIGKTIALYGRLDVLINNAGMSSRGAVENMADTNFHILAETNYFGPAHLSKCALPHLKKTKGSIIFVNSIAGFRGMPYNSAYSASKMAQAALAEALRIELNEYGIHVGIAFVGFTENDPKKIILDTDGSLVYLPKRNNIRLAKPESVAKSIHQMILKRKDRITLTGLGQVANFSIRYLPGFSSWLLRMNKNKIKKEYTMIGGLKVNNDNLSKDLETEMDTIVIEEI
jgi:short-subunit dehydrogenase